MNKNEISPQIRIKATYDKDTKKITAYYKSDIEKNNYNAIPEPYVEMSSDEHNESLRESNNSNVKYMHVIDGQCVPCYFTKEELLERLRNNKKIAIKSLKDKAQYSNIEYNDREFFATKIARENLKDASGEEDDFLLNNWLDVNNQKVSLTLQDAKSILRLIARRDSTIYNKEADYNNAIMQNIYVLDENGDSTTEIDYDATTNMINNIEIIF